MYNEILKRMNNGKVSIIIFDFDYTLTTLDSNSSIGVFSNYLPRAYCKKKKVLDILTNIATTSKFYELIWRSKLKLLSSYYIKDLIKKINITNEFKPNKSTMEILNRAIKSNINVIIYSSGIEEIIVEFLKVNGINNKKVKIIANKLSHVNLSTVITPKKKKLELELDENIILIGDKIDDLKIIDNATKMLLKNTELIEV